MLMVKVRGGGLKEDGGKGEEHDGYVLAQEVRPHPSSSGGQDLRCREIGLELERYLNEESEIQPVAQPERDADGGMDGREGCKTIPRGDDGRREDGNFNAKRSGKGEGTQPIVHVKSNEEKKNYRSMVKAEGLGQKPTTVKEGMRSGPSPEVNVGIGSAPSSECRVSEGRRPDMEQAGVQAVLDCRGHMVVDDDGIPLHPQVEMPRSAPRNRFGGVEFPE